MDRVSFADRIRRLVVLRLGVHVAEHHGADLRHGHGFGGDLRHDLFARLVELLVVHVGDDQHVLGQDQHGDVAADLGAVEVRLEVHQVGHAVAAVEGVVNDVGHQPGVETGLLERTLQALTLRTVVMQAVVVRARASGDGCLGLGCRRLKAHVSIFTDRLGTC